MNDASPIPVPRLTAELVERFTGLICDGQLEAANQLLEQLLDDGAAPEILMCELLSPAARLLGDFWCQDRRDFLEVTLGMARLQQLLRQFRLPAAAHGRIHGQALLLPVPGEQHTFGLRVVEEHLLRAGWKVTAPLAASESELARLAADEHYDFAGFSISSERLLPALRSAIRSLRTVSRNRSVRIAVGGVLFDGRNLSPKDVDADAIVLDAPAAVAQARRWSALVDAE